MSEIKSFSDYTSKYNSNVDFSALFSGTSDSSSVGNTNMLSDYAAIKNGSYGKLMKAYYAKQDAEKANEGKITMVHEFYVKDHLLTGTIERLTKQHENMLAKIQ